MKKFKASGMKLKDMRKLLLTRFTEQELQEIEKKAEQELREFQEALKKENEKTKKTNG